MGKKKVSKKKRGRPVTTGGTPVSNFRFQVDDKARWQSAADIEGVSLSEFLRLAADERAAKVNRKR